MAIFRSQKSSGKSRAAQDVGRHRKLIEKSIKENLPDVIAENPIIGQDGKKKVKIPLRGLEEYRFVHGESNPSVGSGDGKQGKGDKFGKQTKETGQGQGNKPGSEAGEDYYEADITIDELIQYLYDDLELPDIDKKKLADIESISTRKLGYQQKGIPPRLAKRKSVMEKIKRTAQKKRQMEEDGEEIPEDFSLPFHEDDLKYHHMRTEYKKQYNAVIFAIMDVSGSMDKTKKFMARSFYFLLYQFIRMKYTNTRIVFIAHTTEAKEVTEEEFFHKGESGGTYISSGYEKAIEIAKERYDPSNWNIYSFHASDGDNWSEDNNKMLKAAKELAEMSNLFGYGEIKPSDSDYFWSSGDDTMDLLKKIQTDNMVTIKIKRKEDIIPALKKLLEKESD